MHTPGNNRKLNDARAEEGTTLRAAGWVVMLVSTAVVRMNAETSPGRRAPAHASACEIGLLDQCVKIRVLVSHSTPCVSVPFKPRC
jgi:hypothetical protein